MLYHHRRQDRESYNDDKKQGQCPVLLIIVIPEQIQINHEATYQQRHKKRLPQQGKTLFCYRFTTFVPLFLQ